MTYSILKSNCDVLTQNMHVNNKSGLQVINHILVFQQTCPSVYIADIHLGSITNKHFPCI